MVQRLFLFLCCVCMVSFAKEPLNPDQEQIITIKEDASDATKIIKNSESKSIPSTESENQKIDEDQQILKEPDNTVKESFSSQESSQKEQGLLTVFFEDYSWFLDKRETKYKVALLPVFYSSRFLGMVGGARLFSYSGDKHIHYVGTSISNQLFTPFWKWDFHYKDSHKKGFKLNTYVSYDGFWEWDYGFGPDTRFEDGKKLYAHKIHWDSDIQYILHNNTFVSFVTEILIRREREALQNEILIRKEQEELQNGESYFLKEFLVQVGGKIGYDSRDHMIDTKQGHYHQIFFSCVPSLGLGSSFCMGELDLRFYYSLWDTYTLALRTFAGSTFISKSSYSVNYTLGGPHVLRAFPENRFRGDRVHFSQMEVRSPFPTKWGRFLSAILFAEYGQIAEYGKKFKGFKWDVGTGVRVGMPPHYRMKLRFDVGFVLSKKDKPFNVVVDFFQAF